MEPFAWLPALAGAAVGAGLGAGSRAMLARVRRGAVLPRRPMVVAGAVITGLGAGLAWGDPRLMLVLWTGWLLCALGAIDIVRHRLPDALTLPAVPITALVLAGTAWAHPGFGSVVRAVIAAAALWLLFWGLAVLAPAAMGRGDVKLVPSLGLLTGFVSVAATVLGVLLAFVLGAIVSLVGLASRRLTLRSALPFGPFLLVGTWLMLAFPALESLVTG